MSLDWVPEIPVAAVMVSYPPPLGIHTPLNEAQRWCREHRQTHVWVVTSDGRLAGGLSQHQVDLACEHGLGGDPLEYWLQPLQFTLSPEHSLSAGIPALIQSDGIPVVSQERLLGVVRSQEVWRWLAGSPPMTVTLQALPPQYRAKLTVLWQAANAVGLSLYVVGGVVRDLLLGQVAADPDVDAVVVSQGESNAWSVAQVCQHRDPDVHITNHDRYQTVTMTWGDGIWIDLATARTEWYPYPGSPPQVSPSDLGQDLGRRDFSVNALAIRLTSATQGSLVDWHQGYGDLQRRYLRVLHPHSFVEDPTRIFRACRWVVRLGFTLEPWTATLMHTTLTSGIHDRRGGYRLRRECEYLLHTPTWAAAFQVLQSWGAWRCVDPDLHWQQPLIGVVTRVGAWARHFAAPYGLSAAVVEQLRLEALLLSLADGYEVAAGMQMPRDRLQRMRHSQTLRAKMLTWPSPPPPSQVDRTLGSHSVETILLASASGDPGMRRCVYRYLRTWRPCPTWLNGHDLQALGIPAGAQIGVIVRAVRAAQLDQQIQSREEALAWVAAQWL